MNKGRKNIYTCSICGGFIITVDKDCGVTPFAILCKVTDMCDGFMRSSFYNVPQYIDADFEWYKPKSLKKYSREMKEHIKKGGLDLRKIKR